MGLCGSKRIHVSPFRIESHVNLLNELDLSSEEAGEILRGYDHLFGSRKAVVSKELFVKSLIDFHICDWKRLDMDRLFAFASGEDDAMGEAGWIRFAYGVNIVQKKELPRLLFDIYSDDGGASVTVDTVIAASAKMVGKYQVHVSEWGEGGIADTDNLHKKVCLEITGGKYYFNASEFAIYVQRHSVISMGLIILQREIREHTGGQIMWDKISRRRVRDFVGGLSDADRKELEKDRSQRKKRERKKNEKKKQKETLRQRLRHI